MPDTIIATFGLDAKPLIHGIGEVQQHVERAGSSFSKLFALEPLGERRGAHAMARLVEGISEVNTAGAGAVRTMTAFGQSLSTGLVGGAVIGGVGLIAAKFVEANEEIVKTEASINRLVAAANKTGTFQGLEQMRSSFSESTQKAQELYEQLVRMRTTSGLGVVGRDIDAMLHGFTPTSVGGLFGGKESASTQYGNFLYEERQKLLKVNADLVKDMAQKEKEISDVEETRYRVGQRAADAAAEELKNKETLGALSEAASKAGLDFTPELAIEQQRHQQAQQRIAERYQSEQRELALREKQAQLSGVEAQGQMRLSQIQASGLTNEQKSLATALERVNASKAHEAAAEAELAVAQEQLQASRNLGEEEQSRARERLSRAEAGLTTARAGTLQAAAGAGAAAGSQLEREGAEEEMSDREKWAQYWQRQKKYEGLLKASARRGTKPELVEPPKFGEAEYDPTARYRAAATREALGRAGAQQPVQQPSQQQPLKTLLPPDASTESTQQKILTAVSSRQPEQPNKPAPAPAAPPAPAPAPPPAEPAELPARPVEAPPPAAPAGAAAPPSAPPPPPEAGTGADRFQQAGAEVISHIPPEVVGVGGAAAVGLGVFAELAHPQELGAASLTPKQQIGEFERGISAAEAKGDKAQAQRLRSDPDYTKAQRLEQQEQQEQAFRKSREGQRPPVAPAADEGSKPAWQRQRQAAQQPVAGPIGKAAEWASKKLSGLDKMLGGAGWDKQEPAAGAPGGPQFPAVGQKGGPPISQGGQQGYAGTGGRSDLSNIDAARQGLKKLPLRGVADTSGMTLRESLKAQDIASRQAMPGESGAEYRQRMEAITAEDAQRTPSAQNAKRGQELMSRKEGGIRPETLKELGVDPANAANTDWDFVQSFQQGKDKEKAYFADPEVQAGMQGQAEMGRQSKAASQSGNAGLAHQMDRPTIPIPGVDTKRKPGEWMIPGQASQAPELSPFNPITAPNIPGQNLGPQAIPPQAAAGGGGQGGEKPLTQAGLEQALQKYWG